MVMSSDPGLTNEARAGVALSSLRGDWQLGQPPQLFPAFAAGSADFAAQCNEIRLAFSGRAGTAEF